MIANLAKITGSKGKSGIQYLIFKTIYKTSCFVSNLFTFSGFCIDKIMRNFSINGILNLLVNVIWPCRNIQSFCGPIIPSVSRYLSRGVDYIFIPLGWLALRDNYFKSSLLPCGIVVSRSLSGFAQGCHSISFYLKVL